MVVAEDPGNKKCPVFLDILPAGRTTKLLELADYRRKKIIKSPGCFLMAVGLTTRVNHAGLYFYRIYIDKHKYPIIMISLNILYPASDNGRFDVDYYLQKHIPISIREFGSALKGISVEQGMNAGLPGSLPHYVMTAHLLFESESAFTEAFAPIADLLVGDMVNYTDIIPVYQISEVKIFKG